MSVMRMRCVRCAVVMMMLSVMHCVKVSVCADVCVAVQVRVCGLCVCVISASVVHCVSMVFCGVCMLSSVQIDVQLNSDLNATMKKKKMMIHSHNSGFSSQYHLHLILDSVYLYCFRSLFLYFVESYVCSLVSAFVLVLLKQLQLRQHQKEQRKQMEW